MWAYAIVPEQADRRGSQPWPPLFKGRVIPRRCRLLGMTIELRALRNRETRWEIPWATALGLLSVPLFCPLRLLLYNRELDFPQHGIDSLQQHAHSLSHAVCFPAAL